MGVQQLQLAALHAVLRLHWKLHACCKQWQDWEGLPASVCYRVQHADAL